MEEKSNVVYLFRQAATAHPDHIAIIHGDTQVTYARLAHEVNQSAQWLRTKGFGKGDRILVFVAMGIPLYRIVLAIFQIGAIAVVLDEWVNLDRLKKCCKIGQCKGFISTWQVRLLTFFISELKRIPIKLSVGQIINSDGHMGNVARVSMDDIALITFTTGSTGVPKAAERTHGFLHSQFYALKDELNPQLDDIDMTTLPIVLLLNLAVGATSVIAPYKAKKAKATDPQYVLKLMEYYGVNRLTASPFFVKQLAEYSIKHVMPLPCLKKIVTGGAPVFPSEAKYYLKAFPKARGKVVYGSTEAEPISTIHIEDLVMQEFVGEGLLVGKPYHGAAVKIIAIYDDNIKCTNDEELKSLEVPLGAIGEIIVAGPHVLTAYFNNEKELLRNKIFVGDTCWHRTGDSGFLAGDGNLYLMGRCHTLIYQHGQIISPFVYENFLQTIQGLAIGTIMMTAKGLTALVEIEKGASKKNIREVIYKQQPLIKEIVFLSNLPRDPRHHSKIDYDKLIKKFLNR